MAKYATSHIEPKHVLWFVTGAVIEHCNRLGVSPRPMDRTAYEGYINETLDVVWGYLRGSRTLDGRCSDMQCDLAMEARKLFKPTHDI